MRDEINALVDDVERGLRGLSMLCGDPALLNFSDMRDGFERLEQAVDCKAFLDALFAFICERDGAGKVVGAPYPSEYLRERLGLSAGEAFSRLRRGNELFAPPPPPPGDSDGDVTEEPALDFDGQADGPDDAAEQEAARERMREREEQQRRARENARQLNAEKSKIIDRALEALTEAAAGERAGILEKATAEAKIRPPEDLRKYVERLVAQANRKHKVADPNAAWEQRGIYTRQDKASGKYTITIETTAAIAALFKAQTNLGLAANSNLPNEAELKAAGATDPRTPAQRLHDEFVHILQNWEQNLQRERKGAASLVLAMTMDDLADADHTTTFQTNTGIDLNSLELMRLGVGGAADYVLQLDRVTGLPISLGRARLADVHQRIALLALQGVCAWEGCTRPMGELEIHHILAHCMGGDTSLENLIGLCRTHHRQNNDHRDGRDGRRHVERCPETGEVGVQRFDGGPLRVNQTQGHTDSAGYKLRHREKKVPAPAGRGASAMVSDPPLFPPEPSATRPAPPESPGSPPPPPPGPPPSGPLPPGPPPTIPDGCPF